MQDENFPLIEEGFRIPKENSYSVEVGTQTNPVESDDPATKIDEIRAKIQSEQHAANRTHEFDNSQAPRQVIIVCGSGDELEKPLYDKCTSLWERAYGLTPHVSVLGWRLNSANLQQKLSYLDDLINIHSKKGPVSLMAMSASALPTLITMLNRPDIVERYISVAGRFASGGTWLTRLLNIQPSTESFPAQNEALQELARRQNELDAMRDRILTIGSKNDGIIPLSASTLPNGPSITTNGIFHYGAIATPFIDSWQHSLPVILGKQADPSKNIMTDFLTK